MIRKFLTLFLIITATVALNARAQSKESILPGTWIFTAQTPNGDQSARVIFTSDDEGLTGKIIYIGPELEIALTDISFEDGALLFNWADPQQGEGMVDGVVDGDEFEGIAIMGGQEMTITAVKQKDTEK